MLSAAEVDVEAGSEAVLTVRVRNSGSVVDQFSFEVAGDAAPWATFEPPVLSLFPAAEGTTEVRFKPPRSPSTPAGAVPFAIRVISQEDPAGGVAEEGVLRVAPFTDLFAELVPRTGSGRRSGRFQLALDNRGNTHIRARVEATDPDDQLTFVATPSTLVAAPGTAAFSRVEAKPRNTFLRGPSVTRPFQVVVMPEDEAELGALLDRDGVVVCRVAPEDKLRIAQALRVRGHVVAMTGDGVNDGPALRAADIGVAMGAGGTDVARQAADLVLLDDDFATIVAAVRQGRTTFANIRRFLTYHLTDNVAELTPFVVFSVTGGSVPLAIGVLQVLSLDIATDLLPALALGAEPSSPRVLDGPPPRRRLIDGPLLRRAFAVLGPVEATLAMAAFLAVLVASGWSYGDEAPARVLATASGAAFTAVVLGQFATAFACRSTSRPVWRLGWRSNPLLVGAVSVELLILVGMLTIPPLARLLGHRPPSLLGLAVALGALPAVVLADAAVKRWAARRR